MEWFLQNWVWVLFALGMVAMHLFGHGAHGGHEGHRRHDGGNDGARPAGEGPLERTSGQASGHRR